MPILRISDELHTICDEIQAEYDKTVAAMNRAAGKWAKTDTEWERKYGMSEYIITVHDDADPDGGHRLTKPAEPLVRCRDCKHYSEHEWVIATDVSDVCNFWHGKPTKVAPDGFCAWGERG